MSRQIKFRVWNTIAKCFYPREHFALDMDGIELQKMPECEHYQEVFTHNLVGQESMIFMQFTGLLDKNGKEIWEWDVVRHTADPKYPSSVRFVRGSFLTGVGTWPIGSFHEADIEVLGNIYESPELLEAK